MRKTLSILCAACALCLAFSCQKEPASFEVAPTELTWEWDDFLPQVVKVTTNCDWSATISDETNWTLTIANGGKTFIVFPKKENLTTEALTATVTVTCKELIKTVTCTQASGHFINGHEFVDLGLSVKWATCNVGAESGTDYGQYFAWGETAEKSDYSKDSYKWGKYDSSAAPDFGMTKYKSTGPTTLEAGDDPATANWGSKWRTPTRDEIKELLDNCNWTWETKEGVKGYTLTSKTNGNSIFLPVAGYYDGNALYSVGDGGSYWGSSLSSDNPSHAYSIYLSSSDIVWYDDSRHYGQSVRAVTE
ncbi:MAG: hypothetical protein HUJ91_07820 [Bacteroidales bacterium]|nr:hypothetical protein [Bacteroidales bacterium]